METKDKQNGQNRQDGQNRQQRRASNYDYVTREIECGMWEMTQFKFGRPATALRIRLCAQTGQSHTHQ